MDKKENLLCDPATSEETIRTSQRPDNKGEMILYQPDNSLELEVLLEKETVWLSLNQISKLFDRDKSVILRHIKNVFTEEELSKDRTVAKFATHLPDGRIYDIEHYNLDVIISVGYRVKSKRGTEFRQWANKVLRDYLLNGYAVHQRIERVEHRLTETEKKIDLFVRTSMPPIQGVFCEDRIFDAHAFVSELVRSAKTSITLIDNYVDETVLMLLSKRGPNVSAVIHTKEISPQLRSDLNKYNAQYAPLQIRESERFHDRFLIIDDTVYHMGASFKDLGKKLFAFSRIEKDADMITNDL
ncbi:MAG: virulence RhuM family protein [Methanomassiliicoccaceae archaeon]|jgi:hypothetical protein|nr:virulence RhuM family protein [Methanomassiliicoccaceae archaeon]